MDLIDRDELVNDVLKSGFGEENIQKTLQLIYRRPSAPVETTQKVNVDGQLWCHHCLQRTAVKHAFCPTCGKKFANKSVP